MVMVKYQNAIYVHLFQSYFMGQEIPFSHMIVIFLKTLMRVALLPLTSRAPSTPGAWRLSSRSLVHVSCLSWIMALAADGAGDPEWC